jgi:hypothetical protein
MEVIEGTCFERLSEQNSRDAHTTYMAVSPKSPWFALRGGQKSASSTSMNSADLDLRIRERNLKSGRLSEKDLAKHLNGLVDVAENADVFVTPQPALNADEIDDELDSDEE